MLTKNPPTDIFPTRENEREFIIKNYKMWNYKIDPEEMNIYLNAIDEDKRYADVIEYYISKRRYTNNSRINLVIKYCNYIKGEEINELEITNIINSVVKLSKNGENKYRLLNLFGIKYHFDEEDYNGMEEENIIPEKITLNDPDGYDLYRKLKLLENCDITLNYTKEKILKIINRRYVPSKNTFRSRKIYSRRSSKVDDLVIMEIFKNIEEKIIKKTAYEIQFKVDIEFPIKFDVNTSGYILHIIIN